MVHKHEYETAHTLEPEPFARELGIEKAETRKCRHCQREKVFVYRDRVWLPLFKWSPGQRADL